MHLYASYSKYTLQFLFDAGTSRGILKTRDTYFIKLLAVDDTDGVGIGECAPLQGLSIDYRPGLQSYIQQVCRKFSTMAVPDNVEEAKKLIYQTIDKGYPSVIFAFETAFLDLLQGSKRRLFYNDFSSGEASIRINGLIWMGNKSFMLQQIKDKLAQGFNCIKIKIGAIDFDSECEVLQYIRKEYSAGDIEIRLDANGAFSAENAYEKLDILSQYNIHSVEQPVQPGQVELMHILCKEAPIPIALDEELIGTFSLKRKKELLEAIQPAYIILKPTLLGGFAATKEWINFASQMNIGWWITSALESNIGLNAVSQFAASVEPELPQGLGTGKLFANNIPSPLTIQDGELWYSKTVPWDLGRLSRSS